MTKKRTVRRGLRVDAYGVMSRAVEEGVGYGWQRAHKYDDAPEPEEIKEQVARAVMNAICGYFAFDEEES